MIWLIGSNTMLGAEIARLLNKNKIQWLGTNSEINTSNILDLEDFAASHDTSAWLTGNNAAMGKVRSKINWVINCETHEKLANYACETMPEKEKYAEFSKSAVNIARVARKINAKLFYITPAIIQGNAVSYLSEIQNAVEKEITKIYVLKSPLLYGKNQNLSFLNASTSQDSIMPASTMEFAEFMLKIILLSEKAEKKQTFFGKNSALPFGIYHYPQGELISLNEYNQEILSCCSKNGVKDSKIILLAKADTENTVIPVYETSIPEQPALEPLKLKKSVIKHNIESFIRENFN